MRSAFLSDRSGKKNPFTKSSNVTAANALTPDDIVLDTQKEAIVDSCHHSSGTWMKEEMRQEERKKITKREPESSRENTSDKKSGDPRDG